MRRLISSQASNKQGTVFLRNWNRKLAVHFKLTISELTWVFSHFVGALRHAARRGGKGRDVKEAGTGTGEDCLM